VNDGLDKAFTQRENHHHEQIVRALTEDQRRCHQAFKTSTYEQHKNINPNRVEGTCEWALKSSEYQRWWASGHNDLLWISADPGCGKSVLAKSFVDQVFNTSAPTISICYFFFKDNDEQNNLATALCAILHQLFGIQPQLLQHALPSWEKNQDKIQQEVDELWRILMIATSDPSSSYTICVLDALDESQSDDQKQLIQKLKNFHTTAASSPQRSWLKFFVTSRPYDEIQDSFRSITTSFPHIHLQGEEENDQIYKEISLVVKIRVAELGESLKLKPKTQEWLEKELLQMEHRTYLWLYLAINDIHTMFKDSLRPDEESIQLIPRSVNAAYQKILDRVTPEQEPTVRIILQIILGARRPLKLQEMAMALGVATSQSARITAKARVNSKGLGEKIRRLCGLFVFIKDSKIYLIHQTAREFLINNKITETSNYKWSFRMADIESIMTQICIKYLLMDDLVNNKPEENHNIQSFLVYSAQNWPDHFREMPLLSRSELVELACGLYEVTSKQYALWFPLFWKAVMPYTQEPKMSAIHLTAFNGHDDIICRLFTSNKSIVSHQDNTGMDALKWASLRGHYETVRILLENGPDVNAKGGYCDNALYAASQGGHLEVVQLLLENGADVNAQGGYYGNALLAASQGGHHEVMRILLENGADVNGYYKNALLAASGRGHHEVVQIWLENGADVNAQNGLYDNALYAASEGGHFETVKILLERGANVNAQGERYGNALQAASEGGYLEIVDILLERGANVNAQGGLYGNALQVASSRGHLEIVKILLERGADVNAQDGFYGNALQAASSGRHLEIVKILLERGADVNAQGGKYDNALQAASEGGHIEIVKILLERGADVNAQGRYYGNALQAASSGGRLEIVEILLERGADVNAQGGEYGNALVAASSRGHLNVVQALRKNGAIANSPSDSRMRVTA
jgi:ankyrin repeat protein